MTLPVKIKQGLQLIPEQAKGLPPETKLIIKAINKQPIATLPQKELIKQVAEMVGFICRDIGIKAKPDNYDITRFFDILLKYYFFLTLSEIKLAFEFTVSGRLDDFFPKDGQGNPDKNHYQSFSLEYVCKVLNAYMRRKRATLETVEALLPEHEYTITDDEKRANRERLIADIIEQFENYRTTRQMVFIIPHLVTNLLIHAGLMEGEEIKPDRDTVNELLRVLQFSSNRREQKEAKDYEDGMKFNVEYRARKKIEVERIRTVFDKLIAEGKGIDTYLSDLRRSDVR
ncbi:MAG: hypothetical protein WC389_08970 [Lutibacter sp.]|jgi:hypothetical protein